MIFFEIIDGILCDCLWYRYLWGGTWYYVEVYTCVGFITGWIRTTPAEHEEVIDTKDFGDGLLKTVFGVFMFKQITIPMRSFYCELKHRPPNDHTGEDEELIETLILEVPRLKNSDMEKQWAIAEIWNKLHELQFTQKGINQVFVFTAQFGELIIRLEVNEFNDEPSKKLSATEPTAFEDWQKKVSKQFKKLYGVNVKQWQQTQ